MTQGKQTQPRPRNAECAAPSQLTSRVGGPVRNWECRNGGPLPRIHNQPMPPTQRQSAPQPATPMLLACRWGAAVVRPSDYGWLRGVGGWPVSVSFACRAGPVRAAGSCKPCAWHPSFGGGSLFFAWATRITRLTQGCAGCSASGGPFAPIRCCHSAGPPESLQPACPSRTWSLERGRGFRGTCARGARFGSFSSASCNAGMQGG